jgi:hypothetical protein
LFFTILILVRLPVTVSPSLIAAIRRMSARHARVEFQSAAAGGGFPIAEHHADLLTNLVNEDQARVDFETMPVSFRMACDISRACTP